MINIPNTERRSKNPHETLIEYVQKRGGTIVEEYTTIGGDFNDRINNHRRAIVMLDGKKTYLYFDPSYHRKTGIQRGWRKSGPWHSTKIEEEYDETEIYILNGSM